jgi:hypothetical protein
LPGWRKFVCGALIAIAPTPLLAQYSERALLRTDGGTWLNDNPAPAVSAIFPDSLIQTQANHSARIEADGSTVLIGPETVVQYQGQELALDHGTLKLDTSREWKVLIGCITITPVEPNRTQYDVTDVNGKVEISALAKDVKVHLHSTAHQAKQSSNSDFVVHEGEQKSHREHCGGGFLTPSPGDEPLLNSTAAKLLGAGLIVAGCVALFCFGSTAPISPWQP